MLAVFTSLDQSWPIQIIVFSPGIAAVIFVYFIVDAMKQDFRGEPPPIS